MATNFSPLTNPLLRGYDRVSPAISLDFVVGYDSEGWPVYRAFSVGNIVVNERGELLKVQGFTLDNEVLVSVHGLGHPAGISGYSYRPEGLEHLKTPDGDLRHRDGLVAFTG